MDVPHAPGSFEVRLEQEQLDVMWEAYRGTTTILLTDGNRQEAWLVDASDLEQALALDQAQTRSL
jgi:hypothetical protein